MEVRNEHRVIMVGTTAQHMLGDISRPEEIPTEQRFVAVYLDADGRRKMTDDPIVGPSFVGAWVTGLGYIEVAFPVATTRDLSTIEVAWLANKEVTV